VPFLIINDGHAHARRTWATITQGREQPRYNFSVSGVETLSPYSEQEVKEFIHFGEPIGSKVQTEFMFRYRYSDGLPDSHTIELSYYLEGLLGSDAGDDWNLNELILSPYDDGS
jgi:hypothetical protein